MLQRTALCSSLCMGLAFGAVCRVGAAQSPDSVVALTVTVQELQANKPRAVVGVLVELDGERAGMLRTDSRGKARFVGRPLGAYVVRITRGGFAPFEEQLELTVGGSFEYSAELIRSAMAQQLPAVLTESRASNAPGLDTRRATGRGHVFDRKTIDSLAPRTTSDLLRRVPSVRLVASGGGFVPRTRRASGVSDCPMSIYLDGVQIDDERGEPPAPPMGQAARSTRAAPPSVIDGIAVDLLEAVEVYIGASEIPSQFNQQGGSCGVVALWTRAKR